MCITMTVFALKARYVFPVSSAPIADGLVGIEGDRITAVGRKAPADTVQNLGNVAILPGLVNAHTHLEFSDLKKPLGKPGIKFTDWIRRVREYCQQTDINNIGAVEKGFQECTRYGVTTIGDIAQPGRHVISKNAHPVDGTAFYELLAPTTERIPAALELAQNCISSFEGSGFSVQDSEPSQEKNPDPRTLTPEPSAEPRTLNHEPFNWQFGLSPHAPYSVHVDLLEKIIGLSVHRRIPLAMHLAETREELQFLTDGSGPIRELLDELGAYDPTATGPGLRPIDYLQMLDVAARVLIIHGNYLIHDEIGLLADLAESMAVVYCPRTHAFFRNDRYPLEQMLTAGVTVCLGTDSRASSPNLDLLADMRLLALQYPDLPRSTAIELGTLQGAKALGRDSEIGSLQPGKFANLAIVPLPDTKTTDPYELLLDSDLPASATWFRGKKVYP
jgi:aminodeoxyfutalosine deaminase